MDAYYLSNERCFVDLFDAVAKGSFEIPQNSIFKSKRLVTTDMLNGQPCEYDMDFKRFQKWKDNCWGTVLWAKSISGFYFPLIITSFLLGINSLRIKPEGKTLNDNNIIIKTQQMSIDLGRDTISKKTLRTKVFDAVKN